MHIASFSFKTNAIYRDINEFLKTMWQMSDSRNKTYESIMGILKIGFKSIILYSTLRSKRFRKNAVRWFVDLHLDRTFFRHNALPRCQVRKSAEQRLWLCDARAREKVSYGAASSARRQTTHSVNPTFVQRHDKTVFSSSLLRTLLNIRLLIPFLSKSMNGWIFIYGFKTKKAFSIQISFKHWTG